MRFRLTFPACRRTNRRLAVYVVLAPLFSSCIAVPAGKQIFQTERTGDIRFDGVPEKNEKTEPFQIASADNRTVRIGLQNIDIVERKRVRERERITIEKRNKIAFGLFPGDAETDCRPNGAIFPVSSSRFDYGEGKYGIHFSSSVPGSSEYKLCYALLPLTIAMSTVYSLVLEPIVAPFECETHHWVDDAYYDKTEKVSCLSCFSAMERKRIGIWTWRDRDQHPHRPGAKWFTHGGLVGFHKFCSYEIRKETLPQTTPVASVFIVSTNRVSGPFSAFLHLPELGFAQLSEVDADRREAEFNLVTAADGRETASGTIRFLPPPGGWDSIADDKQRAFMAKHERTEFPVVVALPPPRLDKTVGKHEILEISPSNNGHYKVIVGIKGRAKAEDVANQVESNVRCLIRTDYLRKHPERNVSEIRETLRCRKIGENRLEFHGWTFSAVPVVASWSYRNSTGLGTLVLRVSNDVPREELRSWVNSQLRETILSIVSDKNIVLDVFQSPPPGAEFQVENVVFESGTMRVDFSAKQ